MYHRRITRTTDGSIGEFTRNDYIESAFQNGAMGCITDHGLSVPDDISIIGQDNIRLLPFIKPGLTSIDIPYQKQGELAVNLLLKKMKNKYYTESPNNSLSETLIKRDSVKNLKEVD